MVFRVDPEIERLLILQDRDRRLVEIEQQLARLPVERKELDAKIATERAAIAEEERLLKASEVRREQLELDVQAHEEKVRKYKNQQLAVKKNEEYQALIHEISQEESAIGELEELEIGVLLEIDERKQALAVERAKREAKIALFEGEKAKMAEREKQLEQDHGDAKAATEEAAAPVGSTYLERYQQVRTTRIRFPLVVPLDINKCTGCHLRVSGEVEAPVRRREGPVQCNNCGRIVYWED